MSSFESRLDAVLADPLSTLHAPLAYVGADVPLDLLLGTGRPAVHLPWVCGKPAPQADRWLESSFPGWARSIVQQWADGRFDALDQVVFSRGNDAVQRLYYYVCELQRRGLLSGPVPRIFDIAYIERESSLRHTTESVRRLADQLHVGESALRDGIARANAQRRQLQQVQQQRSASGSLHERLGRASLFADLSALLAVGPLPAAVPVPRRILLAGSVPPDDRLHRAADTAHSAIVAEVHEWSAGRLGPLIDIDAENPWRAVAAQRCASGMGARTFADPAQRLLQAVDVARADAVIVWLSADDEGLAWHVPAQRAALQAAGLPSLFLTARLWDGSDGALAEVGQFVGGLRP